MVLILLQIYNLFRKYSNSETVSIDSKGEYRGEYISIYHNILVLQMSAIER